jgi:hypothetical protein
MQATQTKKETLILEISRVPAGKLPETRFLEVINPDRPVGNSSRMIVVLDKQGEGLVLDVVTNDESLPFWLNLVRLEFPGWTITGSWNPPEPF